VNDNIRRITLVLTAGVFVVVVGSMAFVTLYRLGHWAGLDGPNTVGEAGKVYFAQRFSEGKSIFTSADKPPYYASMHGALLHASVGVVGRTLNLPAGALYGIGRMVSILGTVIALAIAWRLLWKLGAGHPGWFALLFISFFAPEGICEHAVSYRPDHWNLALSTFCCWLLVEHPGKRGRLFLLATIPAIAFFIKAPGLALVIPIALALIAEKQWKQALICAITAIALTGVAIVAINIGSEGRFFEGMRSGLSMPIGIEYFLGCVRNSMIWIPLVAPLALVANALPLRDETNRRWTVVMLFWFAALIVSAIGSTRAGSNTYYFVASFLYGLILTFAWIAHLVRSDGDGYRTVAVAGIIQALLYVHILSVYGPASLPITDQTPMDISIRVSRMVGPDRLALANKINNTKTEAGEPWKCFSDDAGLNILLNDPQVIYPLMQSMMIKQGSMSLAEMVGPIEREEYDVVVLTGLIWEHVGVPNLPPEFQRAVNKHYVEIADDETHYAVFLPKSKLQQSQ